jgi:hypothetical protein
MAAIVSVRPSVIARLPVQQTASSTIATTTTTPPRPEHTLCQGIISKHLRLHRGCLRS